MVKLIRSNTGDKIKFQNFKIVKMRYIFNVCINKRCNVTF